MAAEGAGGYDGGRQGNDGGGIDQESRSGSGDGAGILSQEANHDYKE
jgi:hypothetical protein